MSVIDLQQSQPTAKVWASRVLHFGWGTILVGAIAMTATYPGRTHGLGMVTEPLLKDLHDSLASPGDPQGRVFYSTLNFWGTLIGALFCLPVGWLFDRYDRRFILAFNLVLLGWAVLWMSHAESWLELFIGLILTRGLGQSALSVVSITIVAKSFRAHQLGIAMAWYAIASGPMFLLLIQGVGWALKDGWDWRVVWGGIGVSLTLLSATALLLTEKPKIDSGPDQCAESAVVESQAGSTLAQALASPAFWVFSLTISFWGMISSGVALFNQHIFEERHIDKTVYYDVLSMIGIIALASKLFFGWLVNHVRLTHLLAACLLPTACALFALPFATQPWHAYVYGVFLGIASGAVALLFFATWGRLYGRRDLGRIQGVAQMLTVFASAAGPWVFSYTRNLTQSYTFVFHMMAAAVAAMAVIAWYTPLPVAQELDGLGRKKPVTNTSVADVVDLAPSKPVASTSVADVASLPLGERAIQLSEQTT